MMSAREGKGKATMSAREGKGNNSAREGRRKARTQTTMMMSMRTKGDAEGGRTACAGVEHDFGDECGELGDLCGRWMNRVEVCVGR